MTVVIHAMGDHWHPDGLERTPVGILVARAKDGREPDAIVELAGLVARWATALDLPDNAVVTAVAPNPQRDDHLAEELAAAVAAVLESPLALDLVVRRHTTSRLRDTDPANRSALAEAAGYVINPAVAGRSVVLVDDVVLTETTISHIAGLLREAGASDVVGLVATRTRRRQDQN